MADDKNTAFLASRHRNPLEDVNLKPAVNYTWAAIIAIFAFLIFAAVVAIQWMELDFYKFI